MEFNKRHYKIINVLILLDLGVMLVLHVLAYVFLKKGSLSSSITADGINFIFIALLLILLAVRFYIYSKLKSNNSNISIVPHNKKENISSEEERKPPNNKQ